MGPKLDERRIPWCRFNLGDFPGVASGSYEMTGSQVRGELRLRGKSLPLDQIQSVWYRRTETMRLPRWFDESDRQLARRESLAFMQGLWALLDEAVWVSSPESLRRAASKAEQLRRAARFGLRIPNTCVSNDPDAIRDFVARVGAAGDVIYKPHSPIMVDQPDGKKGVVYTSVLDQHSLERLEEVRFTPGIFQAYIEKSLELRITVVGEDVFACGIDSQEKRETRTDWRAHRWNDADTFPRHSQFNLPKETSYACRDLVSSYGLMFGAIDMILDPDGEFYFLEVNPNGQWVWVEQETRLPISDALCRVFETAGQM
jgi:glutathione synthase/RimK-type ligase-like ATP-grasp enzyme